MIKKLLVIILFSILIFAPLKGTFSQDNGEQNAADSPDHKFDEEDYWQTLMDSAESRDETLPEGGETPTYITYPELGTVITTSVTTPAQNTAEGYIFVAAPGTSYDGDSAVLILDDAGQPVYIRIADDPTHFVADFNKQTVQGNDYLTFHAGLLNGGYTYGSSYVLDENYNVVDTWTIDNGTGADLHDFLLLENGHAILMAYVPTPFDLTPYGGPANGTLIDIVLQEQDENKNVIFEWRGIDHMPIEDTQLDLNSPGTIDFLHTNAIDVDDDGNWLLSHRNFSEITKIDRQTGEIIWRLGGAGNEFTFTNDIGFYNQHHINRLENGNISLFDNGNYHTPPHSRAVEYDIDEINKTITRVWQYPDDTSQYSVIMSNIQRLANGNSMIGWGEQAKLSEVEADGTLALEMLLGAINYRAFRHTWDGTPTEAPRGVVQYGASPTAVTIYTAWNGATNIESYDVFAGPTMGSLSMIGNVPRDGFETEIPLTGLPTNTCFFQTQPVHGDGDPTPLSNIMFRLDLQLCYDQLEHSYFPIFAKW